MSWSALIALIADEVGADLAARIESRARREMPGVRLTISQRQEITVERIDAVAPGRPQEAARVLGVHPVTIYRVLRRDRPIR